ncbi:hypothetical protein AN963_29905 [Brevibacillus choshinensis]|uniref:histidine kinase n=1 Tax=Brevibacillus choshinensis TaxID=54911 RepID=A0ABR5MZU3_BRECH|nr:ATP-binding protein [Brevibacillus choshinensis]KQL43628.1 hypothetical protein AN963_29905 [Brevibacillus choshinensis]
MGIINTFNFKASTNIKNLLGKDLVTDQITAVFELVKNSYDADATEVDLEFVDLESGNGKLIIRDNGTGMSLDDIEKKWMVIGTDSKKNKMFSNKFQRPLNGDKGIGRFSVDRLGEVLHLSSVKDSSNEKIDMSFEWTKFEREYTNLDQIKIPYYLSEYTTNKHGVTLHIEKLRDNWDQKNILKLINSLKQFKSPFSIKDDFKIKVHVPEYQIFNMEIQPHNLEDISSLWVEVEIPITDTKIISMTVVRDGLKYTEEHPNPYNFGPVKTKIYFFNTQDKTRFAKRMNTLVKEFGNIRLYRDDFRIHPYGESYNDWLDLDIRKAQGYARFFGSRDLIGYVQIYKEHNDGIDAPTNRQGIIENEQSLELRHFIIEYPIKTLEKYFFKKPKNETFLRSKQNIETAVLELKQVTKELNKTAPEAAKILRKITGVVEQSQKEQAQFVKGQEELLEVYKRVASKEILLHRIIHQALIKIEKVRTVTFSGMNTVANNHDQNEDFIGPVRTSFNHIEKLSGNAKEYLKKARDHLIRKRSTESINLKSFSDRILASFEHDFIEHNIMISLEIPENIYLKIDKNDLETILDNFISNSLKSLKQVSDRNKELLLKAIDTTSYTTLVFKDNGLGVPNHLIDRIFDPFFSTTKSSGMGLSIVDEIVKENKGELNLARNNSVGAEFQIKFRK